MTVTRSWLLCSGALLALELIAIPAGAAEPAANVVPNPTKSPPAAASPGPASGPSGEVFILAPPALRRSQLELDGKEVGMLPKQQRLKLEPGVHQLAIHQGRWRLTAEVTVRAGIEAIVRWPRPGAGQVSYTPTLALLFESSDDPAGLRQVAVDCIHRAHHAVLGEHGTESAATAAIPSACGETVSCLEELAQTHGLRQVLAVQRKLSDDGPILSARLFDAETGDLAAQDSAECAGCSAEQTKARLAALCTEVLRRGTTRPLGILDVTSQPTAAEVLIDGRRLGMTPYHRSVGAGEHQVVIHKTGFVDYQNSVDVEPGRGSALDAVLQADAPPPPPPPPPPTRVPARKVSRRP